MEGPAWLGEGGEAGMPARSARGMHTEDFCSTTSLPRLLGRYLKAYPGVDQTQGLNQGKVLPYVPEQRPKERGLLTARRGGGRGGNEEGTRGGREKNTRAANIKNSLEGSHVVTSTMKMSENSCMI